MPVAFLLLYAASFIALVFAFAHIGMWIEPRLLARFPVLHWNWVRLVVVMAATLLLTAGLGSLAQFDGLVIGAIAGLAGTAVFLTGCWFAVRGFRPAWAAAVLPSVIIALLWMASLAQ